jgi:outer membrane protein
MKKIAILSILFLLVSGYLSAQQQKIMFIDTETILSKIPTYKNAQDQLDQLSKEYQKTVEARFAEVEKLYKSYQADMVLLSDDMKTKREEEIVAKEKDAKELQKKYFGQSGELFQKRQALVKPIQDEIYTAVKELASEGNFTAVIDVAGNATVLYLDPKFDKSNDVLEKLGYKNK